MNIRINELLYLLRGYDLEPGKAFALYEDMNAKGKIFRDYREDAKQTSKLTGPLDPRDPLFRLYYSNDERNKKELQEAIVDYVSYGHGKMFDAIRETYKNSDKPLHEIAQLFSEVFGRLNFPRVEDSEDLLSFPACNTPEAIFDQVKETILGYMEITIPIPVENFNTELPKYWLGLSDKGANEIFDIPLVEGELREIKLEGNHEKPMRRRVQFLEETYDEGLKDILKYEEFHRDVAYSLCTLWDSGNYQFTCQTVFTVLAGNPKYRDTKASKTMLEKIKRVIDDLTRRVRINYGQEAEAYPGGFIYHPGAVYEYEGPLFWIRVDRMKINGQIVQEGMRFVAEPILFELARKKAQIYRVPLEAMQAPGNTTEKSISRNEYLTRRFAQMDRSKKKNAKTIPLTNRTIRWSTLLEKRGMEKAKPSQKEKEKQAVIAVLESWKQKNIMLLDYAVTDEAIYIAKEEPQLKEINKIKAQTSEN